MRAMEETVKLRLLLTSALFLFVQMTTMQAQETLDLAKITCKQFTGNQLPPPSRDIVQATTESGGALVLEFARGMGCS